MNELLTIWGSLPAEIKLLIACFCGATVSALDNEQIPPLKALKHLTTAFLGGFFGVMLLFKLTGINASDWWFVSGIVGFIGDALWTLARLFKAWLTSPGTFKLMLRNFLKQYIKDDETNT